MTKSSAYRIRWASAESRGTISFSGSSWDRVGENGCVSVFWAFQDRGLSGFEVALKPVKVSAWPSPADTSASSTRIASPAFGRTAESRACSVTATLALSRCIGAQKNNVRSVRQGGSQLLRSEETPGTRLVMRQHPSVSGSRNPPRRLCALRQGEAGEAGLPRRQSVLHQALWLLRRSSMHEPRRSRMLLRSCIWTGTRSRRSRSSTCRSSSDEPGRQDRKWSASTRSRSGRGTPTGSS